jgi:hypothetical protein
VEGLRPGQLLHRRRGRGAPAVGSLEQAVLGFDRQAEQARLLLPHRLQQLRPHAMVMHLEEPPLLGGARDGRRARRTLVCRGARQAPDVDHRELALRHLKRRRRQWWLNCRAAAASEERVVAVGQRGLRCVPFDGRHGVGRLAPDRAVFRLKPRWSCACLCCASVRG